MISSKQLNSIDRRYFNVLEANSGFVILQSKNTQHFWYIKTTDNQSEKVSILHSHFGNNSYHHHDSANNLQSAIKKIKSHDAYQIKHRKPEYHLGYSKEDLDRMNTVQYFYF